jgi:hypothetical protein
MDGGSGAGLTARDWRNALLSTTCFVACSLPASRNGCRAARPGARPVARPLGRQLCAFRGLPPPPASITCCSVLRRVFLGPRLQPGFDPRKPVVAPRAVLERATAPAGKRSRFRERDRPLDSRWRLAPARPYDGGAFETPRCLLTSDIDCSPARGRTPVRFAPQPGATNVGTLGLHLVRLLGFEGVDSEPAPGRTQWARVALPDGKQGFVAPGSLMSLTAERLCYIKDLVAGWRIAGYVAGGN